MFAARSFLFAKSASAKFAKAVTAPKPFTFAMADMTTGTVKFFDPVKVFVGECYLFSSRLIMCVIFQHRDSASFLPMMVRKMCSFTRQRSSRRDSDL